VVDAEPVTMSDWIARERLRDEALRDAAVERTLPCPACGRDRASYLTLTEALGRCGYGRTGCFACRLTEIAR